MTPRKSHFFDFSTEILTTSGYFCGAGVWATPAQGVGLSIGIDFRSWKLLPVRRRGVLCEKSWFFDRRSRVFFYFRFHCYIFGKPSSARVELGYLWGYKMFKGEELRAILSIFGRPHPRLNHSYTLKIHLVAYVGHMVGRRIGRAIQISRWHPLSCVNKKVAGRTTGEKCVFSRFFDFFKVIR